MNNVNECSILITSYLPCLPNMLINLGPESPSLCFWLSLWCWERERLYIYIHGREKGDGKRGDCLVEPLESLVFYNTKFEVLRIWKQENVSISIRSLQRENILCAYIRYSKCKQQPKGTNRKRWIWHDWELGNNALNPVLRPEVAGLIPRVPS